MERAIKDLCRLPDNGLFEEVATGIGHVVEVVGRLDAAAHTLSEAEHHHASRIPDEVEHWSMTTLRDKLIKIGAKVVRHGRLAVVAIPRRLFAEILRLIDGLRPKPAPT